MKRQRKIDNVSGNDTFVRNSQGNRFTEQSTKTYQMIGGEVKILEAEPLFKQNYVSVDLAVGGTMTSVAYPGAFIDPVSGNIHGSYEGPIPGQMVMVGFENGNAHAPFVVNRYPYQGTGNSFTESAYINPLTKAMFDATDVITGHFSGSYLSFNTGILSGKLPGSVTINSMTQLESVCALGSSIIQDLDIVMEAASITLQDTTGLNKIELGPTGVVFTVNGLTFGAATHLHPTPVGPSSAPTPGT